MTELPACGHSAMVMLWTGTAIAAVIFAVIVYSIVNSRKSPAATPTVFIRHTIIEVIWAIIPVFILVVAATPAIKPLVNVSGRCAAMPGVLR